MMTFYTKSQLAKIFEDWKVTEKPPKKDKVVFVAFPKPTHLSLVKIKLSNERSIYGKALYSVEFLMDEPCQRIAI